MVKAIIELLKTGENANHNDRFRSDNLVLLPNEGDVIVTGDIHGHRRNFEKIVKFADLKNNPDRHVVLQEIIHGGSEDQKGGCLSFELLFDVVKYKIEFPDQLHIILSNHDTAHINNSEVMKAGKEMNLAMHVGLQGYFKKEAEKVDLAIRQFLFSQPLAVKCQNRIWISHSLPADKFVDDFDPGIFYRQLKVNDVVRPNSAYLLTWGRRHKQPALNDLAKLFDVDLFVLGHQPQETGFIKAGENLIIIASDHNHGCFLNFDLARSYNIDELISCIKPLASIA